jgi:hypothetical protein
MKYLYSRHLVIVESESFTEAGSTLGFQWNGLLTEFSENLSVRAGVHTQLHMLPPYWVAIVTDKGASGKHREAGGLVCCSVVYFRQSLKAGSQQKQAASLLLLTLLP